MQVVEESLEVGLSIPVRNDHRRSVSPIAMLRAEITAGLYIAVFLLDRLQ